MSWHLQGHLRAAWNTFADTIFLHILTCVYGATFGFGDMREFVKIIVAIAPSLSLLSERWRQGLPVLTWTPGEKTE